MRKPIIAVMAIASICHEANRAYCISLGDNSQPSWEDAPEWQKQSAINGVEYHLGNPGSKPSDSHESWLKEKEADGWKYGPVKNPEAKEHPCYVPYEQLSPEQQMKDYIFCAIVKSFVQFSSPKIDDFQKEPAGSFELDVFFNKKLRREMDEKIQIMSKLPRSRERSLAITKAEESVMWLGMDLKRLNQANPYPSSKNETTGTTIEPTADGLKFSV